MDDKENESAPKSPEENVASPAPSQQSTTTNQQEDDEPQDAVLAASVSDVMEPDDNVDAAGDDASEDEGAATTMEEEDEVAPEGEPEQGEEDATAAQARGRARNSSRFGKPAEAGIIKEIYVYVNVFAVCFSSFAGTSC